MTRIKSYLLRFLPWVMKTCKDVMQRTVLPNLDEVDRSKRCGGKGPLWQLCKI